MAAWQKVLVSQLSGALTSPEYVQRRSGLLVLHKLIRVRLAFHSGNEVNRAPYEA